MVSLDAMETYRPSLQPIQIRKSPQTDPAATVQPLTTPQSKCHDPEEGWKPNADYVKTIAETFFSDEKVEYGVVKPDESVNIKLNDTSAKLIHSINFVGLRLCIEEPDLRPEVNTMAASIGSMRSFKNVGFKAYSLQSRILIGSR